MSAVQSAVERTLRRALAAEGRFSLLRRLGAGGMGVVYEAHDTERDLRVALKTLKRVDPASLFRFKQEFRALADVSHRNLVALYELVAVEQQWFFTMELLDGVDFLSYVRGVDAPVAAPGAASMPGSSDRPTATATAEPSQLTSPTTPGGGLTQSQPQVHEPADTERLWGGLEQLAAAVQALHDTGHLHRDIKPSNVLVSREGRVVVLDFGVITELAGSRDPGAGDFIGTPAYAAPEQTGSGTPTPASDWYSVGTILYEALAGRRPFHGSPQAVLHAKRAADPIPIEELAPGADRELAAICTRLLDRDPTARMTGPELLAALRHKRAAPAASAAPSGEQPLLIGRTDLLDRLTGAFELVREGGSATVHVQGRSGMGKTSLVQHFLDQVASREDALVLIGRCYERESVPYQAIDSLVDALCRYLLELPRADADRFIPLDVRHLGRAFPVLLRVEAISRARRRSADDATEPLELRRRAFAALRELFARIAEHRPLILFIDDLQWGDEDSAQFLSRLMQPPTPPLMFLVAYRQEDLTTSSAIGLARAAAEANREAVRFVDLAVEQLSPADACALATSLLERAGLPASHAQPIARESGGNPFFVHEFVRFLSSRGSAPRALDLDLSAALLARVGELSADARHLLETVAVAGRPLTQSVAGRAVDLGPQMPRALAELRTGHWIRTTGARGYDTVESYHDRIRETVVASLAPNRLRALHLDIARGLAASDRPDAESLARHYAAGGEAATAFDYAVVAGDAAAEALAFERAAANYRLALELESSAEGADPGGLRRKLGEALSNAGRAAESAAALLEAVPYADPQTALDLQVRAGSALLRSGRLPEGLEVMRPALADAGAKLATSAGRALMSLLLGRLRTRLRGLRFRQRGAAEIPQWQLTRVDALGGAAGPLGMADNFRGADIQTQHLLAALRLGEPERIGHALVYESAFSSLGGPGSKRRTDRILATLERIATELDSPLLLGLHKAMSALAAYQCGEWVLCRDLAAAGEEILRQRCRGAVWEQSSAQLYRVWALFWLGRFDELAQLTERFTIEARERGDLYAEVSLSTGVPSIAGLAADRPEATMQRIERAFSTWPAEGFHLQHYWAHLGLAQCELYAGDPNATLRRLDEIRKPIRRAQFHRISAVAAEVAVLRSRAAIAAAGAAADPAPLRQQALRDLKWLSRNRMPWCNHLAQLLRTGLDAATTAAELEEIAHALEELQMAAFAATARRRAGERAGDSDAIARADADLAALGVRNPARMADFLAPRQSKA